MYSGVLSRKDTLVSMQLGNCSFAVQSTAGMAAGEERGQPLKPDKPGSQSMLLHFLDSPGQIPSLSDNTYLSELL